MCFKEIMMFFGWERPEPTPCPSDILAGVIAIKILVDPESVKETMVKTNHSWETGYTWEHRGVQVTARKSKSLEYNKKTGETFWSPSVELVAFTRNKESFAPTVKGYQELVNAINKAIKLKKELEKSRRQFEGDMLACEAIKDFV